MTQHIRRAVPGDEVAITAMVRELAEFERAPEQCTLTETQMRTALFGDTPIAHAFVAEVDGRPEDRGLALAFEELRFFSERFEILGVYPADPFRARAK